MNGALAEGLRCSPIALQQAFPQRPLTNSKGETGTGLLPSSTRGSRAPADRRVLGSHGPATGRGCPSLTRLYVQLPLA